MTSNEAIKRIDNIIHQMSKYDVPLGYVLLPTDVNYLEVAKQALEKQIPKKVNNFFKAPDGYLSNGDCPSCKERVDEGTMYCEACGQAIDWSDEE